MELATILPIQDMNPFLDNNLHLHDIPATFSEDPDVFVAGLAGQISALTSHPSSGEGHFCDLFTGLHLTEGTVALKRPRTSQQDQESEIVRRFLREANHWRALQHPNILRFLGACKIDGFIYLVSPYMQNGTVMDFIKANPRKVDRIALIREVGSALEYLHSRSMIHGDLKGVNILVSDSNHALLCDFGLARMDHANTSTTMKGVGTIRWQAPELWKDAPKSFKSDVYAFSMTIVEILSGDVPFRQYTRNMAVMKAVLNRDERPPKEPMASSEGVSYEWLWHIAIICWHRNTQERPPMWKVVRLLECRPVLLPPVKQYTGIPTQSSPTVPQHPTPFVSPRDPFPRLPAPLFSRIFSRLSPKELSTASRVCRFWNFYINMNPTVWEAKLKEAGLWLGGAQEVARVARCLTLQAKQPGSNPGQLLPHPYKMFLKSRLAARSSWFLNNPISSGMSTKGVCLQLRLFRRRVIAAYDDHTIGLVSLHHGPNMQFLRGHEGHIRTLDICSRKMRLPSSNTGNDPLPQTHYHDMLISGSFDRTIRVWDLQTGRNTHTFTGHRHIVDHVAIAKPVWVDSDDRPGVREKWPKHHTLISGSWDSTLMVWRVPGPNGVEYHGPNILRENNPYYIRTLRGHRDGISALAVHGRIVASGSYDKTVRVWDLVTGKPKHIFVGHRTAVHSIVLDPVRKRVFTASLENVIRVWSLGNGTALGAMVSPTLLTGVICLSSTVLVSASIDGSLVYWDPTRTGPPARIHRNAHGTRGFWSSGLCNDNDKLVSANRQELQIWSMRDGTTGRRIHAATGTIQKIAFDRRFCVATATKGSTENSLLVWDFGGGDGMDKYGEINDIHDSEYQGDGDMRFSDSEDEDSVANGPIRRLHGPDNRSHGYGYVKNEGGVKRKNDAAVGERAEFAREQGQLLKKIRT